MTIQDAARLKQLRREILDAHETVLDLSDIVTLNQNELQKESLLIAHRLREVKQITGKSFRRWLQREINPQKISPAKLSLYNRLSNSTQKRINTSN
ncbi:MAG: hypothetical protein KGL39_48455 [Patescibacteria group bacterium]|nr:hypothetical protein [Patescibacteria group bacterium]